MCGKNDTMTVGRNMLLQKKEKTGIEKTKRKVPKGSGFCFALL